MRALSHEFLSRLRSCARSRYRLQLQLDLARTRPVLAHLRAGPSETTVYDASSGSSVATFNMTGVCPTIAKKYPTVHARAIAFARIRAKPDNDAQVLFDSSSVVDTRRNRVLFFNQIMVSDSTAASYWTALDLATKQVCFRDSRAAAQRVAR